MFNTKMDNQLSILTAIIIIISIIILFTANIDSRCRLTDPHINLFCILLTITPATPGLNIFPYFRQKYLCNKENFVKKEFLAKKL